MNELQLREFRTHAEELVDLPDLAELESRGRRMHRRRVALGAGLAAAVLAVTGGLVAATQRDDDGDSTPIEPPDDRAPAEVAEYPGPVMETLDAGTYEMQPSEDDDAPRVHLTLPEGWNAWQGPNRFEGDLETTGWYAGLLIVDVDAVASEPCFGLQPQDAVSDDPAEVVAALRRLQLFRVSVVEESTEAFGYRATHLRIRPTPAFTRQCPDINVLGTAVHETVGVGGDNSNTWVVDVDGRAYVVEEAYGSATPPRIQRELHAIVDSIEFVEPE